MLKKDRLKRKVRIRSKLSGTAARPRVSVFRSNKYVWVQAVDDTKGLVLASFHQKALSEKKLPKTDLAKLVGIELASALSQKKVSTVVFDRNGYRYHGRVKAVAEGLREKGINL